MLFRSRRQSREPLQYILGECPFFEEIYAVSPAVLIPRADTEVLVEELVNRLPRGGKLLDLCTGSGCIALSTLLHTEETQAVMVDLSPDALAVAEQNRERYHLRERAELLQMDILNAFPEGEFDIIASNPPYIPEEVYATLEKEIFAEPKMAFVADEDGMAFYRRILEEGRSHLKSGGFFAFEIGYDQEVKIKALAKKLGLVAEVKYDLCQNPRVAIVR